MRIESSGFLIINSIVARVPHISGWVRSLTRQITNSTVSVKMRRQYIYHSKTTSRRRPEVHMLQRRQTRTEQQRQVTRIENMAKFGRVVP